MKKYTCFLFQHFSKNVDEFSKKNLYIRESMKSIANWYAVYRIKKVWDHHQVQATQGRLQISFMKGGVGAIFLMKFNTSEFETCHNSVKTAYL